MRITGLLMFALALPSPALLGEPLRPFYNKSRCEHFVGVEGGELRQARQVFTSALKADNLEDPELAAAWKELGFEWLRVPHSGGDYWIASESGSNCSGRGFYAFSDDRSRQTVLQVPHRFMDRYTGTIALELAGMNSFRAIAWNTAPRRIESDQGIQDADLAHRWDHYFTAFTRAFAGVLPQGRLVQLHGFAVNKRKSADAAGANIIISAGSHWPTAAARTVSACLEKEFSKGVRLFPRDIGELGATRNVQARLLRGLGHNGFVHVELSDVLRSALKENPRIVQQLCYCLTGMDQ